MTEKNNIYIEDVVDVKELQTLQDNWAKATDLAFVTVDCNGTPITKQSNFTSFLPSVFVNWMHFVKSAITVMPVEDGRQEELGKLMCTYVMLG